MNFDPLQPLDVPEAAPLQRSSSEHRSFLTIFALQYALSLLLVLSFLKFLVAIVVVIFFIIVFLNLVVWIWQLLSAISSLRKGNGDERHYIFLILLATNIALIILFILAQARPATLLSISVLPHALAWYYWYISYRETK